EFKELDVTASADSTYQFTTVSGAAGGSAGVAGVENVNYVNNTVKAYADGVLKGDKAVISASDEVTFNYPIAGVVAAGGTAGVGASVMVNAVTSTVQSYIGGNNVNVKDIDVTATGKQTYDNIIAAGFAGAGEFALSGTVLVNNIDTIVQSYITENSNITADDVDVKSDNTTTLTAFTGAGAVGGMGAVGASVNVNDFEATTESYTGDNVTINAKNVNVNAQTTTSLGTKDRELNAVAGSFGVYAGIAGSFLFNDIQNKTAAYLGKGNTINLADNGKLNLNAKDASSIYESFGAGGGGLVGVGATVGGNEIHNTVLSYIGSGSVIDGSNADVSIISESIENVDALGVVVGAGGVALSGGAVYTNIGKKVENASYNQLDDKTDRETFDGAKEQTGTMKKEADRIVNGADDSYKSGYNDALNRVKDDADGTRIEDKENVDGSLYTKTATSSIASTDRDGTTSAFIDSGATLNVKNLKVNAKNTNDIDLETDGVAAGAGAVGVSVALSEDLTTTNAFVSNGVTINADSAEIKAISDDKHQVETLAAAGGLIAGGGSHAQINSNKTVNAYVLGDTTITTKNNLTINTDSTSDITSYAKAAAFSGLSVGVSVAKADSTGNAKIDIGDNVSLNSQNSNVIIGTKTDEKATAESWAATGGTYSGSGAASIAKTGKNSSVNIGKDFSADVNNKLTITSNAKNYSFTEANGRAYGGVSAGGATGESIISQTSGVNIADATSIKNIKAGSIDISSKVENKAETDIYAGAGALAGFSGSRGTTDITTTDINYVGKNYNVTTSNGGYLVSGDVVNEYKAYDKADSFGVVVGTAPSIKNTVNSTVKSDSEADIESAGSIIVAAKNEIKKKSVSGYDLRGGAGGIAGGSGGSIEDTLTMTTNAKLGGNKAYANGDFGSGDVTVGTYNNAEINEKADLYAGAAIGGSDTDSIVHLTADAKTEIANKDIKTKDDHINYAARNDIDIYTKVNVESYGGFVGTGGKSEAKTNHQYADIVIADGVTSTSGRDTNVSAISNKSLEAYIYERTRGLASVISGHANAYNSDSHSIVTINSGAALKSYDAMNLTAQSTSQKIKVTRDAIAYQLWGIPYKGSGNTDKSDNNNGNGSIVLNGSTESGLGANKSLTINNDSTYTSDGVNVKGLEQVGEISSAEIQVDIDSYKESLKTAKTEYDAYIKSLDDASDSYSAAMETAKTNKAAYENNNKTLTKNKQAAELSLNAINNVDNIATEDYQTTYGSIADVKTLIDAYNALKSLSVDDEGYAAAKSAYDTAYNALTSQKRSLETQISGYETQIQTNNNSIEIAKDAIEANDLKIKEIAQTKLDAEAMYTQQVGVIQGYIDDLTAQKAEMDASGTTTPVYSMVIDDIIVRSGETNVTGNVTGSGSITAPGNKFTITIDNNSVNSVVYGDLILGRNLKGGIYGSSIADSITKTIKNPNDLYKISITNHVDANDPTINFTGNAGDIVLQGNVENVNGAFDLTNYTGNVLSQGSLTARDIHIKVPNGSMSQQYNSNEYKIGGNSGDGAIIVSHDIDISSKIINIHGLIQSGSEIKQVTIPEFSVIKKDDGYYQVVNGVETFMKPSEMTKGYYYLTLTDDTSDVAKIQQIKAYFKPSDSDATSNIPGEIYLFKADIDGGNITLTGNIVNDKNTGKIVLINGYGHIDVTNNSNYDLVTSALNADTNLQGKLTINDFKVGYNDPEYVTDLFGMQIQTKAGSPKYDEYENIKHSDLTDEFISSHTGTYTAYVDENGNIVTSATGVTEGNGSWSSENQTNSTNSFGANVYSTTYTPGADAYSVVNEGGLRSYTVYVKRSWWTELWYGKLYETRYYTADPTYEVKANPIAVNFQGFSTPQINVTSNSNIIMNNSISALAGNVNITTGGNLLTNTANNVISAKNITLNAAGNIGQEVIDGTVFRPIQAAIYDDGKLSAKGKDVYINFPYTGIGSIDINANNGAGNIYLSANEGNFNGTGKTVDIKADSLDLRADNINLDTSENENIHIDIKKLKATAKDDISITNKSHLKLSSIISENQGTITIVSKEGSIVANENTGTYSPYHINGGDVILKAVNGQIGTSENNLKFANKGTFYVQAKGDVYLDSASTIYVDLIESTQGALTVNADLGIIASAITDENRVYNLASKGDMNLTSATGNIENITVNADGTVNAIAGYDTNGAVSGLSDVNITMASQKQLSHDSTEAEISAFNETAKDLKIGTIKASNNVTLTGEKGIKNASDSSFVSGERIAINAAGDIGTEDSAIDLTANREVTVIGSENSNIYLTTSDEEKGLKINTIDSSANGALANVVITSAGNITNNAEKSEDKETVNIRANNISITTLKDIGAFENELTVETASSDAEKGLSFTANKAYIKGLGDKLNITGGETSDIALITGQSASETIQNSKDTEISVNNFTSGNQVSITSENANVSADKLTVNNDEKLMLETGAKAAVSNSSAKEIDINSTDALVSGTIKSDLVDVNTSNDTEIKNAKVSALTEGNDGLLDVETEGNIDISNSEVNVINTFKAGKDVSVANSTFTTDLNVDKSNNTNITGDLTIEGEAIVSAENKLNINNATIDIDNILSNTDVDIISTTVKGDLNVTTDKNITISDANIKKDLNAIAENINIFEMLLEGNINTYVDNLNLKTSNDLHLGKIQGNSSQYTNNAIIESAQNITNGLSANDKNIYAVNANLKAGNSIGTNGKSVNIAASNGNVISIDAQKTASLDTTGSKANYNKFSAEETILKTDEDIKISNLNTDKLTINTSSSNVDITGSVETNGTIRTADKYVVIDNTSLAPHIEADIQLYLTQKPMHLVLDDTNNIKIESKNVTRYNLGYNVNGSKDSYSMESEITLSAASSVNNTNVGEKVIEKSDKSVYEMPTVADYINEITVAGLKDNNTITNINDGTVSNTNITDFVNVDETSKSDISLNEISVQNEDRIMPKTVQKTKFKFQRGMKKKQAAKTQKKLNYISRAK
ncbi:hypothetical protein IJ818_01840, partial [bacterium]|nr:hypothetical protein [bacterium]